MEENKIYPDYYKVIGEYDVLDIIKSLSKKSKLDGFTDHCRFHALKYLFRLGLKDDTRKDLKKAITFLTKALDELNKVDQAADLYGKTVIGFAANNQVIYTSYSDDPKTDKTAPRYHEQEKIRKPPF